MKRLLVAVLLAVSLVSVASAGPEGFRESLRLSPIAQALSVPEAKVYCALDDRRWYELLPREADPTSNAYTRHSTRSAFLMAWMCGSLEGLVKPLNKEWAYSLTTFVHESMHLRGIRDEGEAECAAYRETAKSAILYFGIRNRRTLHKMMDNVKEFHRSLPVEYRTVC